MSGASYTSVLVGTDGSESSYRAVDRAATVARDAGGTLLLLTAYRPRSAREVQDARDVSGELLVVGNRGLDSLAGRLLGSVPATISHKAASDVLTIHMTGKGAAGS